MAHRRADAAAGRRAHGSGRLRWRRQWKATGAPTGGTLDWGAAGPGPPLGATERGCPERRRRPGRRPGGRATSMTVAASGRARRGRGGERTLRDALRGHPAGPEVAARWGSWPTGRRRPGGTGGPRPSGSASWTRPWTRRGRRPPQGARRPRACGDGAPAPGGRMGARRRRPATPAPGPDPPPGGALRRRSWASTCASRPRPSASGALRDADFVLNTALHRRARSRGGAGAGSPRRTATTAALLDWPLLQTNLHQYDLMLSAGAGHGAALPRRLADPVRQSGLRGLHR